MPSSWAEFPMAILTMTLLTMRLSPLPIEILTAVICVAYLKTLLTYFALIAIAPSDA
jgi:hypothetical protein